MGTTGSSEKVGLNTELPDILTRIHNLTHVPLAVGFGIATRAHFDYAVNAGANGVVIGSKLVHVIGDSPPDEIPQRVEAYCQDISGGGKPPRVYSLLPTGSPVEGLDQANRATDAFGVGVLPQRFGQYGGQYVPEALVDCLVELEAAHKSAMADPEFWREFHSHFGYMNRPSNLHLAKSLTEDVGGANIWLKREDL